MVDKAVQSSQKQARPKPQAVELTKYQFSKVECLQCSICMDFIVSCRTAVCGHSFCEECISECMLRKPECPNCRKSVRKWVLQTNTLIDQAVMMVAKSRSGHGHAEANDLEQDEAKRLQERINTHEQWVAKHKVTSVRAGEKLDVLDTEYIWCNAVVELKINACEQASPIILVHYDGWSRKYDEFLSLSSRRVAPSGFYTKRTDIPRYRMCNDNVPLNFAHVIYNPRGEASAAALRQQLRMVARDQQRQREEEEQAQEEQENHSSQESGSEANDEGQDSGESQVGHDDQDEGEEIPALEEAPPSSAAVGANQIQPDQEPEQPEQIPLVSWQELPNSVIEEPAQMVEEPAQRDEYVIPPAQPIIAQEQQAPAADESAFAEHLRSSIEEQQQQQQPNSHAESDKK